MPTTHDILYGYTAQDVNAIENAMSRGLHLFPIRGWGKNDRRPLHRGWQYIAYDIDGIIQHITGGNPLGYLPSSLGLAGIDIDSGNAMNIIDSFPNLCYYNTSKDSTYHVLYQQTRTGIGNIPFKDVLECSGDIRERGRWIGRGGFLMAWPTSIERIESAMQNQTTIPTFPNAIEEHINSIDGDTNQGIDREYRDPPLALLTRTESWPGTRNHDVFMHVWHWARRLTPDLDKRIWIERCTRKSQEVARVIVADWRGFGEEEPDIIGEKIAEYIYAKRGAWLKMQAARGRRSGESRRENTAIRDARICDMYEAGGVTQKEIAESEDISQGMVSYILNRHRNHRKINTQTRFSGGKTK